MAGTADCARDPDGGPRFVLVETAGNCLDVRGRQAQATDSQAPRAIAALPHDGAADAGVVVEHDAPSTVAAANAGGHPSSAIGWDPKRYRRLPVGNGFQCRDRIA